MWMSTLYGGFCIELQEYWDTERFQNLHDLSSTVPINLSPVTIEFDVVSKITTSWLESESQSPALEFMIKVSTTWTSS